jgi:hypothetical protein
MKINIVSYFVLLTATLSGLDADFLVPIVIMPTGRSPLQLSIAGGLELIRAIDVCKSHCAPCYKLYFFCSFFLHPPSVACIDAAAITIIIWVFCF